jgi:hypothetical protein
MSNSTKRKLNFKNARENNIPNEQLYAKVKNKVSGLENLLHRGIKKSEKYKRILNDINTRIKKIQAEINEGKQTLKNLKNVSNKQ